MIQSTTPPAVDSTSTFSRRSFLRNAGLGIAAATLPGAGLALTLGQAKGQSFFNFIENLDEDILNYALNLEYLEAEFYLYATTGTGLKGNGIGTDGNGKEGSVIIKSNPRSRSPIP